MKVPEAIGPDLGGQIGSVLAFLYSNRWRSWITAIPCQVGLRMKRRLVGRGSMSAHFHM
jgi:hypothetical protein